MKNEFIALLVAALAVFGLLYAPYSLQAAFDQWKAEHGVSYTPRKAGDIERAEMVLTEKQQVIIIKKTEDNSKFDLEVTQEEITIGLRGEWEGGVHYKAVVDCLFCGLDDLLLGGLWVVELSYDVRSKRTGPYSVSNY